MYLFRTEEFSGEGVRDIQSVITFETAVLGNTDIWDYCFEHYSVSDRTRRLVNEFTELLDVDEPAFEAVSVAVDSLLDDLELELGKRLSYCLWLARFEDVVYWYGNPTTAVEPSDVILSDLGSEGCLFGFVDMPVELEINIGTIFAEETAVR